MTVNDESNPESHVATFTVATGRYLSFWRDMVKGVDHFLFPEREIEVHVFTDQLGEAVAVQGEISARCSIVVHEVPGLGWPEATLLRYELINGVVSQTQAQVCLHLDADLIFVDAVGPELAPDEWKGGLALVAHPGYWRDGRPRSLPDLRRRLSARRHSPFGGLGTWESRRESCARVPSWQRRTYVCGGVWMGRTPEFGRMVSELARRTRNDMSRGVTAVWHDESHLNWYASQTQHTVLPPAYCAVPSYPWLADIHPRIIALAKGDRVRQS